MVVSSVIPPGCSTCALIRRWADWIKSTPERTGVLLYFSLIQFTKWRNSKLCCIYNFLASFYTLADLRWVSSHLVLDVSWRGSTSSKIRASFHNFAAWHRKWAASKFKCLFLRQCSASPPPSFVTFALVDVESTSKLLDHAVPPQITSWQRKSEEHKHERFTRA